MPNGDLHIIYCGSIVQADLLKCLLAGEGIEAFLQDEFIGSIAPYTAAAGGAGAVKVLVAHWDIDQARAIVEDFIRANDPNDRRNFRLVE